MDVDARSAFGSLKYLGGVKLQCLDYVLATFEEDRMRDDIQRIFGVSLIEPQPPHFFSPTLVELHEPDRVLITLLPILFFETDVDETFCIYCRPEALGHYGATGRFRRSTRGASASKRQRRQGTPPSPSPPTSSTVSSVPAGDPLLTARLFVPQVVAVSSGNPRLIFPALFSHLRGGLCYFSYGIRARDSHEFI